MPEGSEETTKTADAKPATAPSSIAPVAVAKPDPVPPPKAAPDPSPSAKLETEIGADDEIPTDAKLLALSPAALNKRLDRFSKRQLTEHFGTDNVDQIKGDLAELATMRAKQEESRRAALSEQEKLREDAARERARADENEKKYRNAIDAQAFGEYDRTAESALAKHIDPEAIELATVKLKRHVLSLDDDELTDPDEVFDKWAGEWAKKNPKYARAADAPEPKKVKLTTGSSPTKPERSPVDMTNKTARPGQPNSMSRAEFAAYKRQHGLS